MENPFPRLCAETPRNEENRRLLDELGACLTSLSTIKPRRKNYDFYEHIVPEGEEDK